MVRRAGIRQWVRWAGVAVVVALPVVWVGSVYRYVAYVCAPGEWSVYVGRGIFGVASGPFVTLLPTPRLDLGYRSLAWPHQMVCLPKFQSLRPGWFIEVPLWIPWLLAACLTAWRFRADRLNGPGACGGCGYDRRGLAVGSPCPECGAAAALK